MSGALAAGSSASSTAEGPCALTPGDYSFPVPGWPDRDFDLHVPEGYDCATPTPVLLAMHGGSGNKRSTARLSCPSEYLGLRRTPSDVGAPGCLNALADERRFAVVYPNGTVDPNGKVADGRVWNAGGGGKYHCSSFYACEKGIDDMRYFRDLLDALPRHLAFDASRVYATGISNGAAISYRLACELSDRIAAIAPIAGANQFATSGTCSPSRPVPILHMHGDRDPYWLYAGGANGKAGFSGEHISVCETLYGTAACPPEERTSGGPFTGWLSLNGCSARGTPEVWDPNPDDDTTTVWREDAVGCRAPIRLLRIEGGGHTWPGGWQYLPEDGFLGMLGVGVTTREFSANETMWAFLSAHAIPNSGGRLLRRWEAPPFAARLEGSPSGSGDFVRAVVPAQQSASGSLK